MKKKIIGIISSCLILLLFFNTQIFAASASASISGPSSVVVGQSITISVNVSASEYSTFVIEILSDNPNILSLSGNAVNPTLSGVTEGVAKYTFNAKAPGEVKIKLVNSKVSFLTNPKQPKELYAEKVITVNPKATPNRPSTPSIDNNNDKYPSKEELEQRELEARKLVPLVSGFEVISTSDKRNGEVLTTVESQKEQFEYTYKLPKRIDKFKINLKPTAENVTITGDLEHVFNEGDDPVKTLTYTLKDDKIEQTYVIKIEKNTEAMIPVTVDEVGYKIYDDDLLDAYMEGLGFTKTGYPIDENVSSSYFLLESIRLQLLIDNENNAFWYLLDVDNKPVARTVMLSDSKMNIIFILEANEELAKQRIYDNSYQQHNITLDEGLLKVDNNLNFEQSVMAWQWDENLAVYARGIDGMDGTYAIKDGMIKAAVMAFDKTSVMWQYAAIGFGILSVLLAVTLVAYMVKERRWKKKHLSSRDIRRKLADKEIDHSVEVVDKTE